MKIYISGKISGLPYGEVERKFADAEELLVSIGFEVVNPLRNGLPEKEEWIKHLCKDIELLHGCGAIFMLDNWRDSRGARHEYNFALEEGKKVYFESSIKLFCERFVAEFEKAQQANNK